MTVTWERAGCEHRFYNVDFVTVCGSQLSVAYNGDGGCDTYENINSLDCVHRDLPPGLVGFLTAGPFHVEMRPGADGMVHLLWETGAATVPASSRFSVDGECLLAWNIHPCGLECRNIELTNGRMCLSRSAPLPELPFLLVPTGHSCVVLLYCGVPLSIDRYGTAVVRPDLYYVDCRNVIFSGDGNELCPTPFHGPQWVWGVPSMEWSVVTATGQSAVMSASNVRVRNV